MIRSLSLLPGWWVATRSPRAVVVFHICRPGALPVLVRLGSCPVWECRQCGASLPARPQSPYAPEAPELHTISIEVALELHRAYGRYHTAIVKMDKAGKLPRADCNWDPMAGTSD